MLFTYSAYTYTYTLAQLCVYNTLILRFSQKLIFKISIDSSAIFNYTKNQYLKMYNIIVENVTIYFLSFIYEIFSCQSSLNLNLNYKRGKYIFWHFVTVDPLWSTRPKPHHITESAVVSIVN